MRSLVKTAWVAGVLACALSACSPITPAGGDDDVIADAATDGPMGPDAAADAMQDPCSGEVDLEDYVGCVKAAYCDLLQNCIGYFVDRSECDDYPFPFFGNNGEKVDAVLLAELVAQGRVSYDAAAAGQCVQAVRDIECIEAFESHELNPFVTCGAFTGTLNDGSVCYHNFECAGVGSRCNIANCADGQACCTGTCLRSAAVGADCTDRPCQPGAYCVNSKCEPGTVGAPCGNSDFNCDDALWCNQGTCAADYPANSSCVDDDQCILPQTCVGPVMGQATGTCVRGDRAGDPCDRTCIGQLWCDQPDLTQLGECKELPGTNEACAGPNQECIASHECINALCQPRPGVGAACTGAGDCRFGLFCTNEISGNANGTCQAPQNDGASCSDPEHCVSQYCNANGLCEQWPDCLP